MHLIPPSATSRDVRHLVTAVWLAACLLLSVVAPVGAVEGSTRLLDPGVTPRAASPATQIVFTVTYRNREGSAPDHVRVVIDGVARDMTARGDDWKDGAPFRYSTTLGVGVHEVRFVGAGRDKFVVEADGGTVTITTPPKPTPTPTPQPNPNPAPTPTPAPTLPPGSTPSPGSGGGVDGGSGPATDPDPLDDPSLGPGAIHPGTTSDGGSSGGPGGGSPGGPGPGSVPGAGAGSASTDAGTAGPGPAAGGSTPGAPGAPIRTANDIGSADRGPGTRSDSGIGWGSLAAALDAFGVTEPPTLRLVPALVGTTGAATMAMAFAIFGKKRRDEEPPAPDEVLQANAARGTGALPAPVVAPILDEEAGMPRWRRPSLLEARKSDPNRTAVTAPRLSFDHGLVDPLDGRERRVIRYNVVALLDAPDELRSAEIGQLDQGDEVQLLERSGTYWLVLCPDGRQGWLHRMTLGEVVTDTPPRSATDPDEDVLEAYLRARAGA